MSGHPGTPIANTGALRVQGAQSLKPSEVLARAADLISPEGAWTQGDEAHDEDGEAVDATAEDATCWCALGAVWLAAGKNGFMPSRVYLERQLGLYAEGPSPQVSRVVDWNDAEGRTQAEVVQALRDAAELARSEGN